eukprot:5407658-Amphidinium_carterae.1
MAKQAHIDAGGTWSESLDQLARACTRSVLRGLGPARQSAPLDLMAVAALPRDATPNVDLGPVDAVRLVLIMSLFMLREIEAALARR